MFEICASCYEEVDELFKTDCAEKPELLLVAPIGQYHCPDCGIMILAGFPHFKVCKQCLEELRNG